MNLDLDELRRERKRERRENDRAIWWLVAAILALFIGAFAIM